MTVIRHNTVVGVFDERGDAMRAVDELRRVGFSEDRLGVVARGEETELRSAPPRADVDTETGSMWEEGAATGVAAGAGIGALWALGIVAGVLPAIGPAIAGGVLASVLASAAGGAAVAGVLGALIGLGIPEEEARFYEGEFHAGRTLVTVQAPGRFEEARDILRRHGAYDIESPRRAPETMHAPPSAQPMQVPVRSQQVGGSTGAGGTPGEPVRVPVRDQTPARTGDQGGKPPIL
jgi:hypothetical protein